MKIHHLHKLWTALGITLVYYSLNSWIVSQGGEPILDINLVIDPETSSSANVALIALYVCSVLLLLVTLVGTSYAKRCSGEWVARVPIVWFDDLDLSGPGARLWQGSFLFLFLILPFGSLVHFFRSVLGSDVVHRVSGTTESHFAYKGFSVLLTNDYSLGENGVTYFPLFSPLLGGTLFVVAALSLSYNLLVVFRPSEKSK